jgi:hypothetical protein
MSSFLIDNDVYSIYHNKVSHRYDIRIKAFGSEPYDGMVYAFVDYPPVATDGIPPQYRPLAEEFARKAMKELLGF